MSVTHPPVFIVGCGHSGTSLLLSILSEHPNIFAVPYESNLAFCDAPTYLGKKFDRLTVAAGRRRWLEKTPRHIYRIPQLSELFPNAKFLLIIRDGRDVACSIRDRVGSLDAGINRWIEDNRAGQKCWARPDVLRVRYEEIVTAFDKTVCEVLSFLGEPIVGNLTEFHRMPKYYYSSSIERPESSSGHNHPQYRNWQINQPLFDGRGRWKGLTVEECEIIKDRANEMLVEYGYVTGDSW